MRKIDHARKFEEQKNCDTLNCEDCFAEKTRSKLGIERCYELWGGIDVPVSDMGVENANKAFPYFRARIAKWERKHSKPTPCVTHPVATEIPESVTTSTAKDDDEWVTVKLIIPNMPTITIEPELEAAKKEASK
jgi:hypothetical protein